MKFCPYGGAPSPGGAASFCSECGKSLAQNRRGTERLQRRPEKKQPLKPDMLTKKPPSKSQPHPRSNPNPRPKPKPNPQDVNYDGYYDDIQPVDGGDIRDRFDPEVLKRVAIIVAGALLLIIFSVVIMYVL